MKKFFLAVLLTVSAVFASEVEEESKAVDCLILEDENSIICKYSHERIEEDKEIKIQWINPQGEISRERVLVIPAGHGSIYDFRYIDGRMKGLWTFKVEDNKETVQGNFELN